MVSVVEFSHSRVPSERGCHIITLSLNAEFADNHQTGHVLVRLILILLNHVLTYKVAFGLLDDEGAI